MLSAGELRQLRALATRRGRARLHRFYAEGIRVVEDLLASPLRPLWAVCTSALEDTQRGRALIRELEDQRITRRVVSEAEFGALSATEMPQGILVVAEIPEPISTQGAPEPGAALVLVLDGIQDPGNVGTLIRSAEALGAARIILLPGTADPWNPKVVRSAAGSLFRMPVLALSRPECLEVVQRWGCTLVGAERGGSSPGEVRAASGSRIALVLGNEGAGLSPEIRDGVEACVGISLRGRAESLNVAAAAAILLYEFTR